MFPIYIALHLYGMDDTSVNIFFNIMSQPGQVKTIVMEHFNGILFHKFGTANKQHTNQPTIDWLICLLLPGPEMRKIKLF